MSLTATLTPCSARDQATFFRNFVETSHDPVYLITPKGFRFVYVNEACCRHYGLSRERLLAMAVPEWDPNFTMESLEELWNEINDKKKKVIDTHHQIVGRGLVPVEVTINYFEIDGEGYMGGFIKDISHRKELEENLERFAYAVSHDLHEPLRTMTSFLQLVERSAPPSPEISEYIAYASRAAERMRNMIRSLLNYSRLGQGMEIDGVMSLSGAVNKAILNLRKKIEEARAEIIVGSLPRVRGDESLLTLVFQNLIDNAIKYQGLETPRISITSERNAQGWEIQVKDNGAGVSVENREKIFGFLERIQIPNGSGGMGIGLATCRKVMELHQGNVWVTGNDDKGSCFHLFFPAEPGLKTARQS